MEGAAATVDSTAALSEVVSHSAAETHSLGRRLAALLTAGDLVAFRGDLGTGKTCMIQGVCEGLQVLDVVNSPTFILINHYAGRLRGRDIPVYHFDLYRLADGEELADIGAHEFFSGEGVCLIEWADRAWQQLPSPRWEVELRHAGETRRRVSWRLASARPESQSRRQGEQNGVPA